MKTKKLVQGVGINDAGYVVQKNKYWIGEDGKRKQKQVEICPYYKKWKAMLERCNSKNYHKKQPTYIGCCVSEEWLTFSNFKRWMIGEQVKFKGTGSEHVFSKLQLDKDFHSLGNQLYSKETCTFLHVKVNNFIKSVDAGRGPYLIGASWNKKDKVFMSFCNNPFTTDSEYLGCYSDSLCLEK